MTTTTSGLSSRSSVTSRYNPMAEFGTPAGAKIDARKAIRMTMATLLMATGAGICVWLIVTIHAALTRTTGLGFLNRLNPTDPDALKLTIPAGVIQLPPAGMSVLAYVIAILLLGLAAKVAIALVREGASLLRTMPSDERREAKVIAETPLKDSTPSDVAKKLATVKL